MPPGRLRSRISRGLPPGRNINKRKKRLDPISTPFLCEKPLINAGNNIISRF